MHLTDPIHFIPVPGKNNTSGLGVFQIVCLLLSISGPQFATIAGLRRFIVLSCLVALPALHTRTPLRLFTLK